MNSAQLSSLKLSGVLLFFFSSDPPNIWSPDSKNKNTLEILFFLFCRPPTLQKSFQTGLRTKQSIVRRLISHPAISSIGLQRSLSSRRIRRRNPESGQTINTNKQRPPITIRLPYHGKRIGQCKSCDHLIIITNPAPHLHIIYYSLQDYIAHSAKTESEDVWQANDKPSTLTDRGHQNPSAFLIMASGIDKVSMLWKSMFYC